MMRKPSCLISCSHWPPDGSLSVLVRRHGAMNPTGRVRCNMWTKLSWLATVATLPAQSLRPLPDASRSLLGGRLCVFRFTCYPSAPPAHSAHQRSPYGFSIIMTSGRWPQVKDRFDSMSTPGTYLPHAETSDRECH